jgi:hypothetical protein
MHSPPVVVRDTPLLRARYMLPMGEAAMLRGKIPVVTGDGEDGVGNRNGKVRGGWRIIASCNYSRRTLGK